MIAMLCPRMSGLVLLGLLLSLAGGGTPAGAEVAITKIEPTPLFPRPEAGRPLKQQVELHVSNPGSPIQARVTIAMQGEPAYPESLGELPTGKSVKLVEVFVIAVDEPDGNAGSLGLAAQCVEIPPTLRSGPDAEVTELEHQLAPMALRLGKDVMDHPVGVTVNVPGEQDPLQGGHSRNSPHLRGCRADLLREPTEDISAITPHHRSPATSRYGKLCLFMSNFVKYLELGEQTP